MVSESSTHLPSFACLRLLFAHPSLAKTADLICLTHPCRRGLQDFGTWVRNYPLLYRPSLPLASPCTSLPAVFRRSLTQPCLESPQPSLAKGQVEDRMVRVPSERHQ